MMPFFALLTMWSMFEVWVNKRYKWLLIAGISLAFVLQSHYLGLLIIPVIGLLWFLTLFDLRIINQDKGNYLFIKLKQALSMLDVSTEKKIFGRYTFWSLFIFILLMSPLVIFDARHDWMNSKALMAFFTERQTTINFKFYKGFENLWPILQMVFSSMLTVGNKLVVNVILGFLGFNMIFEFWRKGWRKFPKELYLLILWLVVGVLGLSIYKQSIFDHYFGFLYPVPFMLVGWSYYQIVNLGGIWKEIETTSKLNLGLQKKYAGGILIGSMFLYNLYYSPVLSSPNRQLQKTVEISEKIIDESGGQPFNLALISRHNYDEAYRYVLEWKRAQLVEIEPASAKETITEQLFVICENQPPFESRDDNCDPIAHPKAEIALFGWVEIANMWEFDWGHKLYRLVHIK
jgi:hypothetical protein